MDKRKRGMYIGMVIEGISLMFTLGCIFLNKTVPSLVPILLYLGMAITLVCSFLYSKNLSDKKEINKKIVFACIALMILTCITSVICTHK